MKRYYRSIKVVTISCCIILATGWLLQFIWHTWLLEHLYSPDGLKDAGKVRYALEQGVNVNFRDYNGVTPLMAAVQFTETEKTVLVLLEFGADFNLRDNLGRNAIWYAVNANNMKMVKFLQQVGAEPFSQ